MRPIVSLFLLVFITNFACAAPKGPAPVPLEPTVFASILFGTGEGAIKPFELGEVGEGVPTSFCFDKHGKLNLLVPHMHAILQFDSSGQFDKTINLRSKKGKTLPDKAFFYDLAFDYKGRYLILDRSGGWVARFDKKGRAIDTFGHNVGPERIFVNRDGNTIVRDGAQGVLNIFDNKGAFIGEIKGPYLAPEMSKDGTLVRSRIIGNKRAFIWLRKAGSSLPRLFTIITPRDKNGKIYQAECLGFTSDGILYVLTTETTADGGYVSHIYRLKENAKIDACYKIAPNMERLAELPRFHKLCADGRVITFRLTAKSYEVLIYETGS